MNQEKRHPGYLRLGLVDQRGQVVATTPVEFQDAVLKRLRAMLPSVFVHSRGEVVKAVERAYREVLDEMREQAVRL